MRSVIFCTYPQILLGGACGTHERRGKCTEFWWESPKENNHSENGDVDGMIRSEWILGRLAGEGVEWIQLAQDRGRWRTLVNMVMNVRVLVPRSWLVRSKILYCDFLLQCGDETFRNILCFLTPSLY
jgi:hypothetical protein